MLNFDKLQTPPHDEAVLVEPAAESWRALLEQNRSQAAAWAGGIAGVDWAELRRQARAAIGVHDDRPVVLTGHQPEFMHPGVWAKYVVTQRLAAAVSGHAVNLVVDNDAVKTLAVSVPVEADGSLRMESVALREGGLGQPFELLEPVSAPEVSSWQQRILAALGERGENTLFPLYSDTLATTAADNLVDQLGAATEAASAEMNVTLRHVRVSAAWSGPMIADWFHNAEAFASAYNAALADYRREQNIRSSERPIPDLIRNGDRIELPLWAYGPSPMRRRIFVRITNDRREIFVDDQRIGALEGDAMRDGRAAAAYLRDALPWRIRPRALTLTLWARLLAGDLFVHGIGGAKYDRIANGIMQRYYHLDPPEQVCVSATLHLPLPRTPVTPQQLAVAKRRMRDVRYQPDRWLASQPNAAALLAARRGAIDLSEWLRDREPGAHAKRRDAFEQIRALNGELAAMIRDKAQDVAGELARLERARRQDRVATHREYFFALHPRQRLQRLCDQLPAIDAF